MEDNNTSKKDSAKSEDSKEVLQESGKSQDGDIIQDKDETQSDNTPQDSVSIPVVGTQPETNTEPTESEKQLAETQKATLEQLEKLNEGITDFKEYIQERNDTQDEETAKEKEEEKATASEKEESADSNALLLSALNDLSEKFDIYTEQNAEILTHMENIEFNTSYGLAFDAVLTGFLSLVAGILFGRVAFRKL